MISIIIIKLNNNGSKNIEIDAVLSKPEFSQLNGNLDYIRIFARDCIVEKATTIKTGARHQWAKYLLFPKALRRKFSTVEFDFNKVKCGAVEYKENLFVIYQLPKIHFLQ